MDARSLDQAGFADKGEMLAAIVEHTRTARLVNRHPRDFIMVSVTPDWLMDLLEPGDVENMLALYHVRMIRRSEMDRAEQEAEQEAQE